MTVERNIDGSWFGGHVVSVDRDGEFLTIKYFDDDNIEDMVPASEVRVYSSDVPIDSPKLARKNPLLKPLVGLMDDDENERRAHRPVAIVHSNDSGKRHAPIYNLICLTWRYIDAEEKAIIINGSSTKLAAGGGLRALRYLK